MLESPHFEAKMLRGILNQQIPLLSGWKVTRAQASFGILTRFYADFT
jgi:hypothetical protein